MASLADEARVFCGDCHAPPRATSFPKDAWPEEVARGYRFYMESGRTDLKPPRTSDMVRYYRALAPEELKLHPAAGEQAKHVLFRRGEADLNGGKESPAISYLGWLSFGRENSFQLVMADMRSGRILPVEPAKAMPANLLGEVSHPAHVELCDLDGNHESELIVADLGSFLPADHNLGKVVWLKPEPTGTGLEAVELLAGLGRVADARPADFDGDGDQDLVVAEFGWQKTGSILWLENLGAEPKGPKFERHQIDRRHGAIHVCPCDLNSDGRLDFVALVSQEHEKVEAFLNLGSGKFECRTLYAAGDPAYGSSGIDLVDLDHDGDLDVLYTNGDTFDSFYLKPYHSIQWLENRGEYPFVRHHLAHMPGVHRARYGDFDGDGDLDIAAAALIPASGLRDKPRAGLDSVLWLEQVAPGEFKAWSLEQDRCWHAALEVGDLDADGDLDLAVGNFRGSGSEGSAWCEIWWNQRNSGKK